MIVKELTLRTFRNYEKASLKFEAPVIIIIGNNAQGKTNLVESIYTLAFSKSYRARSEKELIFLSKDFAKINAMVHFTQQDSVKEIDYVISSKGKKIKVNNVEQTVKSDFVGLVNVIKFSPEDLELVKGSPNVRRKFIDMYLSQLDKEYLITFAQYNRLIKQKNAAFKQEKRDEQLLGIYNRQLAKYIEILSRKRKAFIEAFYPKVQAVFNKIVEGKEELDVQFVTQFEDLETEEDIFEYLQENMPRELRNYGSLLGVHKDDLVFTIDGKNARQFGSQGQQRTIVLSLIIALVDYMQEIIGEYPILILDDVMSELDEHRKVQLLESFHDEMQIFLTTTSVEDVIDEVKRDYELYEVMDGTIKKIEKE